MENVFTVVIVTFNRITLLQECLECVLRQTYPVSNMVIVDNASTDGTREYLKELCKSDERITVFYSSENRGGAEAFRKCLEIAYKLNGNRIILIDDAMLSDVFLDRISKAFADNPDIKAFAGAVYTEGRIDTSHRKVVYDWDKLDSKEVKEERYQEEYFMVDLASFCGLAISKELISLVGYPCGEYFIWYDDTEYSLRLRKYTNILVVSEAELNHKVTRGKGRGNWKLYYGERNLLMTVKKHGSNKGYRQVVWMMIRRLLGNVFSVKNYLRVILGKDDTFFYYNLLHFRALRDGVCGVSGRNDKYLPS